MRALQAISNGPPLDVLKINDVDIPAPGPGQVRIKVSAASLNFNDIDRCYGRRTSMPLTPPFTLGMDVCGIVDAVGDGAQAWQGQRVVALTNMALGGIAEYALAPADSVFTAPPEMSDAEAAAFIIPFHTAYLALVRRAQLAEGETLLVHAGASSVGAAAIQIARALGVSVLATVSSEQKADYCRALGAELTINHQTQKFDEVVLGYTGDVGANVILDLAGGEFVEPSWRCIAREGRYIAAGFADDDANGFSGKPLRPSCAGNFSIVGVMLGWASTLPPQVRRMGFNVFNREVADSVHDALLGMIAKGQLTSILSRSVPLEEAAIALTDQENRKTTGRTVVTF